MKIEVKNLLNQPEGSVEHYPLDLTQLSIDTETSAKFMGEAVLTNLDDLILAQITGQTNFTQPCSRCLKEVNLTIPLEFSREFKTKIPGLARNDDNNNEEAYPIEDGRIDLTPVLTEEIIANVPVKILCSNTCKGLCPKCGNNLNDNSCQCDKVNYEIRNRINL